MTVPRPVGTLRHMGADPILDRTRMPPSLDTAVVPAFAPASAAGPVASIPNGGQRTVLIVDDEPAHGTLLAMALHTQGWRTVVATAADHAADIARDLHVDLLVTDFRMPGMSGLELAASLRARRAKLPVLLVSGSPDAEELAFPQPFAFLAKPFSLRTLFGTIGVLAPAERLEA